MISTLWLHADQQYLTKCSYNKGTANNYLPPFSGLDLRYNATVLKNIIVDISIYIGLVWKISFNTCCQLWPKLWFVDFKTRSNIRHSVHCLQTISQTSFISIPDICHFFSTYVIFGSIFLHTKVRKSRQNRIRDKMA